MLAATVFETLQIKKLMNKSEAIHRISSSREKDEERIVLSTNEEPIHYGDIKSQRMAFQEFLRKRQVLLFNLY